jgi:hypothetical protein
LLVGHHRLIGGRIGRRIGRGALGEGGNVMLNDAKVIKTDVVCSNGVIHWVDTVLMPPAAK